MGNKNIKYKVRTFFRLKELELGKDKFWLFDICTPYVYVTEMFQK